MMKECDCLQSRRRVFLMIVMVLFFITVLLGGRAYAGYWKQGKAVITERHESLSQYGHEFKIISSDASHVLFEYRDGLTGNRTRLLFKWSVPSIIRPEEVIQVSLKYDLTGPPQGSCSLRFDLPGGCTDGGKDILCVTLGPGVATSGRIINNKIKAPESFGDRAIHVASGLTGGLSFKVSIKYDWIEGSAPTSSGSSTVGITGSWKIGTGGIVGSKDEKHIFYTGTLVITEKEGNLYGTLNLGGGIENLESVSFDGNNLIFVRKTYACKQTYRGKVSGDRIIGTFVHVDSTQKAEQYWEAEKL